MLELYKQSPYFEPSNEKFLHCSMLSIQYLTAFNIASSDRALKNSFVLDIQKKAAFKTSL